MENKNQTIITGLLILLVGILLGYLFVGNTMPQRGGFSNDSMHEEMEEHMYGDEHDEDDESMMHAMDEMMFGLSGKSGEEYEEAFLRGMIVHHVGAINMAKSLLKQTDRPELVELANNIIRDQSHEIDVMEEWLEMWFNENSI